MSSALWRITAALALALPLIACAGVSADEAGAPDRSSRQHATGDICGGIAGFQCESDADYCAFEAGTCVNIADGAGVCTPKPEFCTMDYRPVCGCDGETYSNACAAASARISVASDGACAAPRG